MLIIFFVNKTLQKKSKHGISENLVKHRFLAYAPLMPDN